MFEKGQYANGITNFGFPHFVGSDFDSWDNLGQGDTVAWDQFVDSDFDSLDNRHKSRHVYSIIKNTEASRISLEELKSLIDPFESNTAGFSFPFFPTLNNFINSPNM